MSPREKHGVGQTYSAVHAKRRNHNILIAGGKGKMMWNWENAWVS